MAVSYRFGEFTLDPARRELLRGDAPVAVPPRAFDCIVYLLEHRERAVGRDELIAAVWGRTETGDGTLGQTVLAARRALDDTGKEQHAIRTVFRFGYHWVAPVEPFDSSLTPMASAAIASTPIASDTTLPTANDVTVESRNVVATSADPRRASNAGRIALAIVALLVIVAAIAFAWKRESDVAPTIDAPAGAAHGIVALVLPVTVNAGSGYDWVRLGLMDLIGARLRAAGLAVVSSDSVVALTGRGSDAASNASSLARRTGATLVVDARAESVGARWRVMLTSVLGRDPPLTATGESADVLAAARDAADRFARELGFTPARRASTDEDPLAVDKIAQEVEAAMLSDNLDTARALLASATPAQRAEPELRLRQAQIDYQAGDFDAAAAGFGAVAEAASAEQDPVIHARAITNLGVISAMRDDTAAARNRLDAAIDLLRAHHASDPLGKALNARANVNAMEEKFDAALHDFAEARAAFESAGDLLALAVLDSNLAAMDEHRYHYAEAQPAFERAAQRFATFGVNSAELNALAAAAEIRLSLLEPDAALAMEPELRALIAKVADPARKRSGELTRIEVLAARGRIGEATTSLAAVIADAEHADDRGAVARGHMIAARLARGAGDPAKVITEADAALASASAADDPRERARTFRLRIRALLEGDDAESADAALKTFAAFADGDGSAPAKFYAHLAAADVAAARGDASAGTTYAAALTEADAMRIPLDIREAASAYADWLVARHDLAGASATAERVTHWAARDYDSALVQLRVQRALGDEALWRASLARALALAGERSIPGALATAPAAP
jgi:DNA-binding winged helix-turn-helix (wHTH) protein